MKLRYYKRLYHGEKIPRKAKKIILGYRIGKSKLRRMINDVRIIYRPIRMWDSAGINCEPFCPNCGCELEYGSGNMSSYPEHWEVFRCCRCHSKTANIDNSPYYHILFEIANEKMDNDEYNKLPTSEEYIELNEND